MRAYVMLKAVKQDRLANPPPAYLRNWYPVQAFRTRKACDAEVARRNSSRTVYEYKRMRRSLEVKD